MNYRKTAKGLFFIKLLCFSKTSPLSQTPLQNLSSISLERTYQILMHSETVELGIIGKLDKAKKIFSSQEYSSISRVKNFFQRCIAELECLIQQSHSKIGMKNFQWSFFYNPYEVKTNKTLDF